MDLITKKRTFLGVLAGTALLAAAAATPAGAARVTVEVEGLDVNLPATVVDTPASVSKGGQSCPSGANVIGALDAATGGDWGPNTIGPTTILGEARPFASNQPGWVFVINGKTTSAYSCGATLADGDRLLWYVSAGFDPYRAASGWDEPVLLDAPTTVAPGQPFAVKVTEASTVWDGGGNGTTTIAPAAGATVAGGTAPATTAADGSATLTVAGGPYELVVTKGNRAPARLRGCATTGSDGRCGTTLDAPAPAPAAPATAPATPDTRASFGRLTGIVNGKHYKKGRGPRQLAGTIDPDRSGLKAVELRLTRRDGRRCFTYDARRERLVRMKRCGAVRGTWFSVGDQDGWRYLLPRRLPRGRYVLDLKVTDRAGNVNDHLIRGRSRLVFHVA